LTHLSKIAIAAASWIALTLLFAIRDHWLGLAIPLTFDKVPLSPGEALRYIACTLAVITTIDLCWRWIEPTGVRNFVNRLGRRSLGMFVAHIWIVGWTVKFSLLVPHSQAFALLFMVIATGVLWALAVGLDELSALWAQRYRWAPRMEYATLPAMMASVALVLIIVNPFVPLRPKDAGNSPIVNPRDDGSNDQPSDVPLETPQSSGMINAPQ
jgi:hypothetical protein